MTYKVLLVGAVSCIFIFIVRAQTIKKNEIGIGAGFGNNIFNSPKEYHIKNDFYYLIENDFEITKTVKQSEHYFNLKTKWHTFTENKTLNKSNVELQYTLKYQYLKKLRWNLKTTYVINKANRINILGELLKFAHHYQTFGLASQLNYSFNKQSKIKLDYAFTPYIYFNDNKDYNHNRNEFSSIIYIDLKHIGRTKKTLQFLIDISNRNYLYKISKNLLGERPDKNQLWNWSYYEASVKFFEEVDYDRDMNIRYSIEWKDDNFEGYYNYLHQNIRFNYAYHVNLSNSLTLTTEVGFRKYKHRVIQEEQRLRYIYPEVTLKYSLTKEKLKFTTILQTLKRKSNFMDVQSLTRRNYNSLLIETQLSYNFIKNG